MPPPARDIQAIISAILLIAVLALYLRRFGAPRRWLVIALGVCLLDQAAKAVWLRLRVLHNLWPRHHESVLGGWLRVGYEENKSLGFGGSSSYLLATTAVCAAILWIAQLRLARRRYRMAPLTEIAGALVTGGLFAILLDRIRLGHVMDLFDFGERSNFTYNVADLAAFAAAGLLALRSAQWLVARVQRRGSAVASDAEATSDRTERPGLTRRLIAPSMLVSAAVLLALVWRYGGEEGYHPSPLHKAALKGDAAAVARLLARGADVNALDEEAGCTPLHAAASAGHLGIVRMFLAKGANVNAPDKGGKTALVDAAFKSRTQVVAFLLNHGADPNGAKSPGLPVGPGACARDPQVLKLLLAHGADVSGEIGRSALRRACFCGRGEMVRLLLSAGIDANQQYDGGQTALHLAAASRSATATEALLAAGAAVDARDKAGQTPLLLAMEKATTHVLIAHGANVNARAHDRSTLLMRAALQRDPAWVKMLLTSGADVNAANDKGWTALHYAAVKGQTQIVEALLAAGANINAKTHDGATPLRLTKDEQTAALLREHGGRS